MKVNSYVGNGTAVKGNLECGEDFFIEGAVEGNLRSDGSIVLGREAVVRGEVTASEVAVSGIVIGTIQCSTKLDILKSAKIVGIVQAPVLNMESGAKVHGRIVMSEPPEKQQLISHSPKDSSSSATKDHH